MNMNIGEVYHLKNKKALLTSLTNGLMKQLEMNIDNKNIFGAYSFVSPKFYLRIAVMLSVPLLDTNFENPNQKS